ncbi:protein dopey-1 homolog isoform X2 [Atheta coriaria]|uniref:protein dopey-1 homolog isoform X2 n=1 Tax=Dalotia coriaria TaxID=877792 RepID=UPI0031F4410E
MSSMIKLEEYELLTDSKYRIYATAVEKALKNFEYTAEWADLISALGKLNKVLTAYQKFPITPRRIKICKRLAQCMHPALPSGVHLKALETYDIMFKSMGTNRLAEELFIYGAGLFPLLGHSAMFIRPTLLLLYETHFVPLRERLRPALSGFLSGVLPGLEIGSDHFDRTNSILENVCEGVGPEWFYTCIWQGIRSNSPVRLPAISYILAHYNRKLSMEDQLYLMGRDIDVMISGLCAAVQDSSVLVQRSALDLLMVCFPTWNTQLLYADMVRLVTAALTTILRRDMSLNRRLYSWLLTSETRSERNADFQVEDDESDAEEPTTPTIAIDLLMEAIRVILKQGSTEIPLDVKPYRLLTSLFDKPQIGPMILDNILYDVFRALYTSCLNLQKHKSNTTRCVSFNGNLTSLKGDEDALKKSFLTQHCQELTRNANLLFNTLQTYYIWSYIERLFEKSVTMKRSSRHQYAVNDIGSGEPNLLEICVLTDFLLDIIPIETYAENTVEILPNLFSKIINVIREQNKSISQEEILASLKLCSKILTKIQPCPTFMPKVSKIETQVEKVDEKEDSFEVESLKNGLEKSKSDSKINEKASKHELSIEDASRERSNSNQMKKNKNKDSPKIDKKSKSKKSKSSSKLYDLKKEDVEADAVSLSPSEKKEERVEKPEKVQEEPIKVENKHIIMCLKVYKRFYETLLADFIMQELKAEVFFESLLKENTLRNNELMEMLEDKLYERPKKCPSNLSETRNQTYTEASNIYDESIQVASNLLIEFAAFPNILQDDQEFEFPHWLKVLVGCSCSPKANNNVKITCMNTLLKIISISKTQSLEKHANNNNVVLMGILDIQHVIFIEENTIVLECICEILWDLLGYLSNQNQLIICANLLYSIHNVFDTKMFVEHVIGKYLVDGVLCTDYFKRFFLLWHGGRELKLRNPSLSNSAMRNFDHCLLKIMDNLNNQERPNIRLLSETFVTHSLLRHDIARIINPLLSKLLSATTARISIRFVNIEDPELQAHNQAEGAKAEDVNAKKIYAISSVNGNVMFHVTDGPSPKPSKKRWFLFPRPGKKGNQVVNMTTSLTDNLNVVTKRNKDFKPDVSPNIDRAKNNVKLFINPLSSKEIYPNGVDGCYTKLDSHSSTESLSDNNTNADSGFVSMSFHSVAEKRRSDNDKHSIDTKSDVFIEEGVEKPERVSRMKRSKSLDEKTHADVEDHLQHSWSESVSESDVNSSLDVVRTADAAEDYFKMPSKEASEDIALLLNDILEQVCPNETNGAKTKNFTLYPIHQHLCLYYEVFDSNQIIYTLRTLKNCINSNPLLFIRCLATSGLKDLQSNNILYLLARHRKSIQGGGFGGELSPDHINVYRGFTFLDVLITITLNYIKSFYPCLDDVKLTRTEQDNNLQIQLDCLEILDIIIKHLINIVNDNSKGFSGYIADTLKKCILQKVLLHCLLMSVRNFDEDASFAEEILLFNNFKLYDNQKRVTEYVEAYQILLLRLINSLIILEFKVFPETVDTPNGETATILIPQQSMFLSAILSALKHQNMKHLHQNWCHMVTSCLPYFNDNLKQISLTVIHQICNNIEKIADAYMATELGGELCADYATTQLESLTILVHYNLLDSTQTANQNLPTLGNTASTIVTNTSDIFNNLVNAFFSPIGGEVNLTNKHNKDNYQLARKAILSHMPRIISSVAKLWQTIVSIDGDFEGVFGHSKIVKQQLLEFLSPIAVHHSSSFLAAIAVAWHERKNPFMSMKTALPEPNTSQNNLVYLISAIRVIPLDNLVQTVTAVIKNPPPTEGLSSEIFLDVSILELFYCYMRNTTPTQISEAWSSLLALIREGCSLSPQCQFLLAALLHELMIKCCPLEERKDQKDLQDVTSKLIECVSQVCGACLEQTTWLRRNLAVKEQEVDSASSGSVTPGSHLDVINVAANYSVQAQLVLSEILAQILDICFGSVEKDKVNSILSSLMGNIVPYLRTHTLRNMPSFNACSKLMASLSSYQYTRKAWKKDVFDLLLDNTLFQMDQACLKYWKVIVDNLMTHDNTTFRDLMIRVSLTQSGSLNIFASREQEYEQRAHLLKRLAFVIFCSETDQYAKYMSEIQEQLTASLRLCVPSIQAQVFMCFRVLLIRMSPLHVTSLWPIIISEMLQVYIQIEQELQTDSEEFSAHIKFLSTLDPSWTQNSNNGLHALGNPHWLRLQLAAAKLLDLALLLPATSLPQFQMYRWAFVEDDVNTDMTESTSFTPHVCRIANLMDQKYASTEIEPLPTKQNELLLTVTSINQLQDLHPFFKTLSLCSNRHRSECNGSVPNDLLSDKPVDKKMQVVLEKLDKVVEADFLDKIPR